MPSSPTLVGKQVEINLHDSKLTMLSYLLSRPSITKEPSNAALRVYQWPGSILEPSVNARPLIL